MIVAAVAAYVPAAMLGPNVVAEVELGIARAVAVEVCAV